MIKKVFDYYYLVLLRGYENLQGKDRFFPFHVAGTMSIMFGINTFSFVVLLTPNLLDSNYFWIGLVIILIVIMVIIDFTYNRQRRERLQQEYKDEYLASRQCGVAKVAIYMILSVALLVWAFSRIQRPSP